MIPKTGSWYRFKPADWQFIIHSLALSEGSREGLATLCSDPDEALSILDHPKLFEAVLMSPQAAMISRELFFFVVVRHTLKRIGVDDLEVADYIAIVCADFGIPTTAQGQPKSNLERLYSIDWMQALQKAGKHERFFIHVQCANQFLVLTCLFPSFLHHRAQRRGAPDVEFYEQVVINHLDSASKHSLAGEFALEDVFTHLSEAFLPVRRAMNYTLREYLHLA